jgi:1-acyl-sn-glycerol-3-phosphate acyltransferase
MSRPKRRNKAAATPRSQAKRRPARAKPTAETQNGKAAAPATREPPARPRKQRQKPALPAKKAPSKPRRAPLMPPLAAHGTHEELPLAHDGVDEEAPLSIEPHDQTQLADEVDADLDLELASEAPELGLGARIVPPHLRFEAEIPDSRPPAPVEHPPNEELEAQIRALEARLDGLIRRTGETEEAVEAGIRERVEEVAREAVERITSRPATADNDDPVAAEYVARKWGREALRNRQEDVDDFGLDPAFEEKLRPMLTLLYRKYFRVQVEGMDNVPDAGAAVLVANHSGTVPLDGAMLRTAIHLDHPSRRDLRWLAEDFVFYLPFAGVVLNRIGAVRACPENAERLLEQNSLVAVFPEGVHGIKKLFSERYRLQRFGRGGYIRLCLRTKVPLVPCAIVGAEETNPLLYRLDWPSALVKLPYVPITPTFPLLGPLGLLPVPTRWKIRFGEPISFDRYGPEAADDHVLVSSLSERVRASIQDLIDGGLRNRKSIWFG